ncbi:MULTISPECIES: hypothetical protein [unclassified Pseudomonas]|uniref:DUF7693 family protein n=1 Tax=unclassified Pseudomonas TaxID=196821 RepID=UPI002AC90E09|nr:MULTISPECIES: hypothetical protein [unclassified Pseudomonas]MEB0045581.1 hypothetical protein [Pseudomonas sp. Dout3]MEB0095464.1 hypothetical protein [Pseudomonas sp. DC1.2]WPX61048.1 hypothetical protein RHM68_10565 [Pseudomonas sp. DC1.2]
MPALTAREICQCLRDAALEVRSLRRRDEPCDHHHVQIDIEGWHLTLVFDGHRLHHCQHCRSPDGREGTLDAWRFGTDPVSLLSTWELAQLERLLR